MNDIKNLKKRVLILGGYGVFGSRIAKLLSSEPDIHLIIAGRDKSQAELLASSLSSSAEGLRLECNAVNLPAKLRSLNLDLLIHCAGPFQNQDYRVAQACIEAHVPYIDIADGRRFVCDFPRLSTDAKSAEIPLISGASSLPALSSAVLWELQSEFAHIRKVEIGIAPAHRVERGLATVRAGFESLGDSFPRLQKGQWRESFTGNRLRKVKLAHPVGERWLLDFDVPDLELWPSELPELHSASFGTGLEPYLLQLCLSLCARLARQQIPVAQPWLAKLGQTLAAHWPGGSQHGGMQILLSGTDRRGEARAVRWQILGLNGDGPWIPAAPAAALARKLLRKEWYRPGAHVCWQLLTLEDILAELAPYSVITAVERLDVDTGGDASTVLSN